MQKTVPVYIASLVCATLFANAAWADFDCPKMRPLTADEETFFRHFSALQAAIPPVPEGWRFSVDSQKRMTPGFSPAPTQQCAEYPDHNLGLAVTYRRITTQAEVNAAAKASAVAPDPAQEARVQKLLSEQQKLLKSMQTAAENKDTAAMQKLNEQAEALGKRLNAAQRQAYAPMMKAAATFSHDREARVDIAINAANANCYGNPEAVSIPGATAYRCTNETNYDTDGNVVDPASAQMIIVLGRATATLDTWTRHSRDGKEVPDKDVTITASVDARQPLKVQDVVVTIDSDNAARVAQLYHGLKLDGLRKLINTSGE